MGLFDSIKDFITIPEEDEEFEEETLEIKEAPKKKTQAEPVQPKKDTQPRILGGNAKAKTVNFNLSQMQVILVKPDRFDDVTSIADHLNENKTVVLNLESCERDVSRRIVDFLSGVAYANHGNIRKIAVSSFIIVPSEVDVAGELPLDDFDVNHMYF